MNRKIVTLVFFLLISITSGFGSDIFDMSKLDFKKINSIYDQYSVIAITDYHHSDILYKKLFFDILDKYLEEKADSNSEKMNIGIVLEMPQELLTDYLNYINNGDGYKFDFEKYRNNIKSEFYYTFSSFLPYECIRLKELTDKYRNTNISIQLILPEPLRPTNDDYLSDRDFIIKMAKEREKQITENIIKQNRSDKLFILYGGFHYRKYMEEFQEKYESFLFSLVNKTDWKILVTDMYIGFQQSSFKLVDYREDKLLMKDRIPIVNKYRVNEFGIQLGYTPKFIPFNYSLSKRFNSLSKNRIKTKNKLPGMDFLEVLEYDSRKYKVKDFEKYFNKLYDEIKRLAIKEAKKYPSSYYAYKQYTTAFSILSKVDKKTYLMINDDKGVENIFESLRKNAYIKQVMGLLWFGDSEEKEFAEKELKRVTGESFTTMKEWLEWYHIDSFYEDHFGRKEKI